MRRAKIRLQVTPTGRNLKTYLRLKLLRRKIGPEDRRKILAVKKLKRANRRKKEIDSMPVEQRRPRQFCWITEDMAAIQQLHNTEEAMEIIGEKISTRKMKEMLLKEAGVLESGKKRKMYYD